MIMKGLINTDFDKLIKTRTLISEEYNRNPMKTILSSIVARLNPAVGILALILLSAFAELQAQDFGRSLDFDGINDQALITGANDVGMLEHWDEAYAIEFWMKDNGSQVDARFLDIGSATTRLYISPNNAQGLLEVGLGGVTMTSATALPTGWVHVAVSVSAANQATLFIDGVQVATAAFTSLVAGGALTNNLIGRSFDGNPSYKGKVDEMRFWRTELTATDIADRLTCELSGNEGDLIAYYKFNGGVGDGFNGGFYNDVQATNFGKLSRFSTNIYGFALNGTESNWSSESAMMIDASQLNALELDGSHDYFQINDGSPIVLTNGFTIQMWVHPKDLDNETFFQRSGRTDVALGLTNGKLIGVFDVVNEFSEAVSHSVDNALIDDQWQHVCLRAKQITSPYNIIESQLLVDGQVVSSIETPFEEIATYDFPIRIGRDFRGRMSNIQVWSKSLSDEEVEETMSQHLAQGTPDLTAQYNTFSDFSLGLVDHINGINAVKFHNPVFASDPCFVTFGEAPQDTTVSIVGGNLDLEVAIENCTDINFQYQWLLNGEEIADAAATQRVYSISNLAFADLGRYSLRVTACGNSFTSEEFKVDADNLGKVLKFDGVNDYVSIPTNTNSQQYTIETWVRFHSDPANQSILFLTNGNGPDQYFNRQLRVNADGQLEHSAFNDRMITAVHPDTLYQDRWYHLRAVINPSDISLAIDGVEGNSADFFSISNVAPGGGTEWLIGHPVSGHDPFDGEMADLRIWTGLEDSRLDYELFSGTGLEHYFKFDEGIAGANNASPIASDTIAPTFTSSVAQLHNFDLVGDRSNWLGCDQASATNTFTTVPQSGIYDYQDSLILSCEVTGDPASASYQWFKNNKEIRGATDPSYIIAALQPADQGDFYVRVSDEVLCDVYSPIATIAVEGPGQVLAFDGIDDYLEIKPTNSAKYTIEMWVKFDSEVAMQNIFVGTNANNTIFSHHLYTDEDGYFAHYTDMNISTGNFVQHNQVSTIQAEPNKWYHVAIRASSESGEDISMVIDGQVVSSSIIANGTARNIPQYLVGRSVNTSNGNFGQFKGEIDALHIYDNWKDIATFGQERFVEKKYIVGLNNSFLFNQGIAAGDNTGITTDGLLDYGRAYENTVELGNCRMINFAKNGSTSNFVGCSPAQKPAMFIQTTPNDAVIVGGQDILLSSDLLNFIPDNGDIDVSDVNYQWLKNGEIIIGENDDRLGLFPAQLSDTGVYRLIVTDDCPLQFIDTTEAVTLLAGVCYTDFASDTIDLATQSSYLGGTGVAIGSDPVFGFDIANPLIQDYDIQSGYCGADDQYPLASVAYYWNVTEPKTYDVKMTMGSMVNVDMWIFDDQCDIGNCLASSTNPGTETDSLNVFLDIGEYYIVMDTKDGIDEDSIAGRFYLDITEVDNCASATPIACGDIINDDTATGSNDLSGYCNDFTYTGTEKIYQLDLIEEMTIDVSLREMSDNLDLFIIDNTCRLDECVASSTNGIGEDEAIQMILSAGTYFIVVDGQNGASGTYELSITCKEDFTASFDDNDAYVDLDWSLNAAAYVPQDTGLVVRLVTVPNTILYEEEYNTAAQVPAIIAGDFRDYIGPNLTKPYRLKIINRLSGVSVYNELQTGRTLPFQEPEILSISQGDAPHKIDIQWRNHSKLSDNYRILRDGVQVAALIDGYTEDSLVVNYTDTHDINDASSIQDNASAVYSIRAFSTNFFQSYDDVDTLGSTSDINFNASDNTFADKIELTWADLSPHCNRIKIERNGIILDIIGSTEISYMDMTPLPVRDVTVALLKETIIDGEQSFVSTAATTTDFLGRYIFDEISYGLANDFQVAVNKLGSTFISTMEEVSLNGAIPAVNGVDFVQVEEVVLDSVTTFIDMMSVDSNEVLGLVDINWDYSYPMSSPVTFFLYRDGNLIFEGSDANGKVSTFRDLTGVPNNEYKYTLQAYAEDGTATMFQSDFATQTYPVIPALSGFDYVLGEYTYEGIGGISLHNSTIGFRYENTNYSENSINADGLRFFRNGRLIGEIQEGTQLFEYLAPPGIEADYTVRAFRKIGEASYESATYPENDSLITALELFPVFVGVDDGIIIQGLDDKDDKATQGRSSTGGLMSERAIPVTYKDPDPFGGAGIL